MRTCINVCCVVQLVQCMYMYIHLLIIIINNNNNYLIRIENPVSMLNDLVRKTLILHNLMDTSLLNEIS